MKKIFVLINFIILFLVAGQNSKIQAALCCPDGYGTGFFNCPIGVNTNEQCCHRNGWGNYSVVDKIQCPTDPSPIPNTEKFKAGNEVTQDIIDGLNPLIRENSDPELAKQLSTPGGVISRFLGEFAFPIAGLILFVMLIWGGIEMMAGSATSKSVDAGKQRVTTALLGFLLLFSSFWIARILEMIFGIKIL